MQPTHLPKPTVGELYPSSVGEMVPKGKEVFLPEKGRGALSRQKRWIVSHRPDPRVLSP